MNEEKDIDWSHGWSVYHILCTHRREEIGRWLMSTFPSTSHNLSQNFAIHNFSLIVLYLTFKPESYHDLTTITSSPVQYSTCILIFLGGTEHALISNYNHYVLLIISKNWILQRDADLHSVRCYYHFYCISLVIILPTKTTWPSKQHTVTILWRGTP